MATLGSSPGKVAGVSILSSDTRALFQKLTTERQERTQSIEDLWQEVDKVQAEMRAMAQAMATIANSHKPVQVPQAALSELQGLRSEVALLKDEVKRQQQELTSLRGRVEVLDKSPVNAAGPAGGNTFAAAFSRVFARNSDTGMPREEGSGDDTDMSSWSGLLSLRVRLEAVERIVREGPPARGPQPLSTNGRSADGDELTQCTLRVSSLERKVNQQSQDVAALHAGIAEVHKTMSLHALRASKIAINVVEMNGEQRQRLNDEINDKESQLGMAV